MKPEIVKSDWPAAANVCAFTTTRLGGVSQGVFSSFNLGAHVRDVPEAVAANRAKLREEFDLATEPCWLTQVHGSHIVEASVENRGAEADASYASGTQRVCAILTADCVPILLCNRAGTEVAAAHGGWRGLVGGVIPATIAALSSPPGELMAWLGPAISAKNYRIGEEVYAAISACADNPDAVLEPVGPQQWHADLYGLARQILAAQGVTQVYGGEFCTYAQPDRFYSYRRDGDTGRMASVIWLKER
jgi:hypothetical protein